jgi:hypothetical protein
VVAPGLSVQRVARELPEGALVRPERGRAAPLLSARRAGLRQPRLHFPGGARRLDITPAGVQAMDLSAVPLLFPETRS